MSNRLESARSCANRLTLDEMKQHAVSGIGVHGARCERDIIDIGGEHVPRSRRQPAVHERPSARQRNPAVTYGNTIPGNRPARTTLYSTASGIRGGMRIPNGPSRGERPSVEDGWEQSVLGLERACEDSERGGLDALVHAPGTAARSSKPTNTRSSSARSPSRAVQVGRFGIAIASEAQSGVRGN